jgi:hypothetical protein
VTSLVLPDSLGYFVRTADGGPSYLSERVSQARRDDELGAEQSLFLGMIRCTVKHDRTLA